MRIIVDADACFVKNEIIDCAYKYGVECFFVCDETHSLAYLKASVITVAKGPNSADYAIIGMLQPGDIVVTGDVGLAAISLAKNVLVINNKGHLFNPERIDAALNKTALHSLYYRMGLTSSGYKGKNKHNKKTLETNRKQSFSENLDKLLQEEHQKLLEKRRAEEEQRRLVQKQQAEEARQKLSEKRRAEEEQLMKVEEARQKLWERRRAEEEQRRLVQKQQAQQEQQKLSIRRRAEEEQRMKAEEARRLAQIEAKYARRKARQLAEEQLKQEEARRKANSANCVDAFLWAEKKRVAKLRENAGKRGRQ